MIAKYVPNMVVSGRGFEKPYAKIYKNKENKKKHFLFEKSLLAKGFWKIDISDEIKNIRNVSPVRSSVAVYVKRVGYVGRLRESPNMSLDASLTLPGILSLSTMLRRNNAVSGYITLSVSETG